MIAPFWSELKSFGIDPETGFDFEPATFYATEGVAPNRVFYVEFTDFTWRRARGRSTGSLTLAFPESSRYFEVSYGGELEYIRSGVYEGVAGWQSKNGLEGPYGFFARCTATEDCRDVDYNRDLSGHVFRVTKAVEPELRMVAFEAPSGAFPGDTVTASITAENVGLERVEGVDVGIFLSVDDAASPSTDRRLATIVDALDLPPEAEPRRVVATFQLPADVAANERFHLYALADVDDAHDELIETDNAIVTPQPNFATGYDLTIPACRVTTQSIEGAGGTRVPFEVEVANRGIPYAGDLELSFWATPRETVDVARDAFLGAYTVRVEGAGTTTFTVEAELPPEGLPGGAYFPACIADFDNDIREVDDQNRFVGGNEDRFFVPPELLTIVSDDLPEARVGVSYAYEVQVIGGVRDRDRMTFRGFDLPEGLSVSADGRIEGRPSRATGPEGQRLIIEVQGGGDVDREGFVLVVLPPPPLEMADAALTGARLGVPYEAQLEATGGAEPRRFRLGPGGLPSGLVLDITGRISGTPTELGEFEFEVVVTDSPGPGGTESEVRAGVRLTVESNEPRVVTERLPEGQVGQAYLARVEVEGGAAPLTWRVSDAGALPEGLVGVAVDAGRAYEISGRPTRAASSSVELVAEDALGQSMTARYDVVIEPAPPECEGQACEPASPGTASGGCRGGGSASVVALLGPLLLMMRRRGRR